MRIPLRALVCCWAVSSIPLAAGEAPQADGRAAALLSVSQQAIGTTKTRIKSFTIDGTARARNGASATEQFITGAYAVRMLLPDHYLRIQSIGRFDVRSGFSGTQLLNESRASRAMGAAAYPPEYLAVERANGARLLLELFLATDSALPVTLDESLSRGSALRFTAAGFESVVSIDAKTHLPSELKYTATVQGQREEVVWAISDHRSVGQLLLPHHLVRTQAGTVRDDITIHTYVINAPLTPESFKRPGAAPGLR